MESAIENLATITIIHINSRDVSPMIEVNGEYVPRDPRKYADLLAERDLNTFRRLMSEDD